MLNELLCQRVSTVAQNGQTRRHQVQVVALQQKQHACFISLHQFLLSFWLFVCLVPQVDISLHIFDKDHERRKLYTSRQKHCEQVSLLVFVAYSVEHNNSWEESTDTQTALKPRRHGEAWCSFSLFWCLLASAETLNSQLPPVPAAVVCLQMFDLFLLIEHEAVETFMESEKILCLKSSSSRAEQLRCLNTHRDNMDGCFVSFLFSSVQPWGGALLFFLSSSSSSSPSSPPQWEEPKSQDSGSVPSTCRSSTRWNLQTIDWCTHCYG